MYSLTPAGEGFQLYPRWFQRVRECRGLVAVRSAGGLRRFMSLTSRCSRPAFGRLPSADVRLLEDQMNRVQLIISVASALVVLAVTGLFGRLAPDSFRYWKDILEALSYLVVLLGVPVGLFQYFRAVKKEQLDREYGTYNALDEKFLEFQNMCLAHPDLDIFDVPDKKPGTLTAEQQKKELIAFTILFSIFERAYLMYHDQSTAIKQKQWTGWDEYIRDFCRRENFKRAWRESGATYDKDFEEYIRRFMQGGGASA